MRNGSGQHLAAALCQFPMAPRTRQRSTKPAGNRQLPPLHRRRLRSGDHCAVRQQFRTHLPGLLADAQGRGNANSPGYSGGEARIRGDQLPGRKIEKRSSCCLSTGSTRVPSRKADAGCEHVRAPNAFPRCLPDGSLPRGLQADRVRARAWWLPVDYQVAAIQAIGHGGLGTGDAGAPSQAAAHDHSPVEPRPPQKSCSRNTRLSSARFCTAAAR